MVSVAHAMGQNPGGQQGGYEGIIMMVAMFAIFYFLLIRPQQKRAKQQRMLVESLKVGDQVVTSGGIHGKIAALEEQVVTLEITSGVKIRINRSSVVAEKQA